MGGLISRLSSRSDDNYEKILSKLDDSIRLAELRLTELKISERRYVIRWIVISTLFYIFYVIAYLYFSDKTPGANENWDIWALKVAPVFTGPALIIIIKNFLSIWYKRVQANEETSLKHLKAQQKLKVEELKKKTGYYTTKTLLERYDSPKNQQLPPNITLPPGQKGLNIRPGTPGQPGQHTGQTPIDSNLRQRIQHSQAQSQIIGGDTQTPSDAEPNASESTPLTSRLQTFPAISSLNTPTPLQRRWYDKLVDVIVGDEGPDTKYALICANCYTHNGLALPQEIDDVQYICPKCNHFNASRRNQREGTVNAKNGHLITENNDKSHSSISGTVTPRRGRSTTPKPMSRDSSSEPERKLENDDEFEDDGVAVSKRLASRSTSRRRSSRSQNRVQSRRNSNDDDDDGRSYGNDSGDEGHAKRIQDEK